MPTDQQIGERVEALLEAMTMKFCSQPETFPVFRDWCVKFAGGADPELADIFSEMKRDYMVVHTRRAALKALDVFGETP